MSTPALLSPTTAPAPASPDQPIGPAVHAPGTPLPPDLLLDVVDGLAAAEDLWRPLVSHDPTKRTAVRLVATDAYEVWLLGWLPGQGVERHDHGGSAAGFRVVEGELVELQWEGDHLTRQALVTGERRTVAAGTVHDVVNAGTAAATSLHAYSPPLTSMTFFDPIDGTYLRTEVVEPEPALVDGRTAGRALHPSADRR